MRPERVKYMFILNCYWCRIWSIIPCSCRTCATRWSPNCTRRSWCTGRTCRARMCERRGSGFGVGLHVSFWFSAPSAVVSRVQLALQYKDSLGLIAECLIVCVLRGCEELCWWYLSEACGAQLRYIGHPIENTMYYRAYFVISFNTHTRIPETSRGYHHSAFAGSA